MKRIKNDIAQKKRKVLNLFEQFSLESRSSNQ